MSIVTKTGDAGATGLMFNRRVSKNHPRVEAYGSIDELNAAMGVARACSKEDLVGKCLLAVQKDLVTLMGELATEPTDLSRYVKDGFAVMSSEQTLGLEKVIREIESEKLAFDGWATPGATIGSAMLDVARTTCRRAERRVCALHEAGQLQNPEIIVYLNRLSDLLWLLARWSEVHDSNSKPGTP